MKDMDYIEAWKEIMQRPSGFYRKMPKTGGYVDPIIFATVSAAISALVHLLFTSETDDIRKFISMSPMVFAIMMLIIGIIALFTDATILHIVYKILGGTGTYEGTVRFVLYSSAALSLLWIPLVGWVFGIYQIYLYIVGGKFVHNISMERSAMAIILSVSLVFVFAALADLSGFI